MPAEKSFPAIGDINQGMKEASEEVFEVSTVQTTEAHPTMELRFVKRMMPHPTEGAAPHFPRLILQQRWAIITFRDGFISPDGLLGFPPAPVKRETEWRDVPLVEE